MLEACNTTLGGGVSKGNVTEWTTVLLLRGTETPGLDYGAKAMYDML
jgi:hypothetical protein